jgi:hypothetical protein
VSVVRSGQHLDTELRFGREPDLGPGPGRAPVGVFGPRRGQIEFTIHQRPTPRTAVSQEYPELTVVDLPAGAGVLARHPRRTDTLLDESGVINDPHPRRVAELIHNVSTQVITHPVDIPVRRAQQPLHPVRRHRPRVLSQRPAVLTLQTSQQPTQIGTHPSPRLDPAKPARDQLHHRIQRRDPPSKIHHAVIITAGQPSASHDTPNCRCSINGKWERQEY